MQNLNIKTTQNLCWFQNCWEKREKIANRKVTAKTSVKNQRFFSSILLTCKSVWQITFCWWIFFDYFHRFEISVKFCEFRILICQKRTKFFWFYCSVQKNILYFIEVVEYLIFSSNRYLVQLRGKSANRWHKGVLNCNHLSRRHPRCMVGYSDFNVFWENERGPWIYSC